MPDYQQREGVSPDLPWAPHLHKGDGTQLAEESAGREGGGRRRREGGRTEEEGGRGSSVPFPPPLETLLVSFRTLLMTRRPHTADVRLIFFKCFHVHVWLDMF